MAVLGLVGVSGLIGGLRLGAWVDDAPGPGLLPIGASALLVLLVGLRLLSPVAAPASDDGPVTERRRLTLYIVGLVLFGLLFDRLGLPIAALAALLTVLSGAERMAPLPALATALAMILGALLLFDWALGVPLPWGPLAALRIWGA